jgi:cation:H+ antiporter
MIWALLALAAGLGVLVVAADRLVISAVRLSRAWGVSAVLIGALVVGFGTSVPELLVSALAAADGRVDVALANVIGSNIANVTLVVGGAALVIPIVARRMTLKREGLLMLTAVTLLAVFLWDLRVAREEGAVLVVAMAVALYLLVRWSKTDVEAVSEAQSEVEEMAGAATVTVRIEVLIGAGTLVATVVAARLLLEGALFIGESLGLSDVFLGLMLGVGTSLPELATALAATRRAETDLVVGNVLGSNLFNSLGVAGVAILIGPGPLQSIERVILVVMVGVAVMAGSFAITGRRVVRWEGVVLVAGFVLVAVLSV